MKYQTCFIRHCYFRLWLTFIPSNCLNTEDIHSFWFTLLWCLFCRLKFWHLCRDQKRLQWLQLMGIPTFYFANQRWSTLYMYIVAGCVCWKTDIFIAYSCGRIVVWYLYINTGCMLHVKHRAWNGMECRMEHGIDCRTEVLLEWALIGVSLLTGDWHGIYDGNSNSISQHDGMYSGSYDRHEDVDNKNMNYPTREMKRAIFTIIDDDKHMN